jgi:hypothetical protein
MTANDAPLKRPRPCHVRGHGGEGRVKVPRVERSVRRAEQFDFRRRLIWHEEPRSEERFRLPQAEAEPWSRLDLP